ncbi:polyprenol phosphomannose-dependent alpha 1,6 mannosyltransferase MptB [Naumannella cuiyingiana]|uniref:Alpha-1,6-mannosyltransferase n=1 Tax=Naumannella cuiyingiana TaxID=1347891 RepID=A0A7Z0D7X3_9ACTN|nr:polyprenol phosphomannose-dependent alpha 1,6 mannosyltransferase MptB [Naumannella cuiyingiana]NYI70570.1 hypothetical protein [Naumannella cuiyingiana]
MTWGELLRRRWAVLRALVADAWAVASVRRGMVASLLLALGAISPAYLPENSPWYDIVPYLNTPPMRALATGLTLFGVIMLADAWFQLRPRIGRPLVDMRVVVALWTLPMLFAPPVFSDDSYAYAAEGWLIHNGVNPYNEGGVSQIPGVWAEQVIPIWRYTPAPYGPVALQINHLVVDLFGFNPYWSSTLGMRLLSMISMVVVAACLPALARRVGADPRLALWFAIANPVVMIHVIGGAHNDAVMLALLALALWMANKGRFLVGCLLVAAATAVKIPAIVGVVPVALLAMPPQPAGRASTLARQWHSALVVAVGTVATVIAFVVISLACGLGWGWVQGLNVPGMVSTIAPTTMLGEIVQNALNELGYYDIARRVVRIFRQVGMIITVFGVLYLYFRHAYRRPIDFLAYALVAITMGGPALHPWYLTWWGTFLPLTHFSRRVVRLSCWGVIIVLAFSFLQYADRNSQGIIGMVGMLAIVWAGWANDRLAFGGPPNGGGAGPSGRLRPEELRPDAFRYEPPSRRPDRRLVTGSTR